jgi:hypothetical protein
MVVFLYISITTTSTIGDPDVMEGTSSLTLISNELTKFYHVISHLDEKYVAEVKDIINSPP